MKQESHKKYIKPKEEMTTKDYQQLGFAWLGDKKYEFKEKINKIFKRKKSK